MYRIPPFTLSSPCLSSPHYHRLFCRGPKPIIKPVSSYSTTPVIVKLAALAKRQRKQEMSTPKPCWVSSIDGGGWVSIRTQHSQKNGGSAAVDQRHVLAINLLALKFYYGGTVFGREAGWEQGYPKAMALWRLSAEE